MRATGWLQPRDRAVAAHMVSTLCMVAGAVTIVFALGGAAAEAGAFAIVFTVVLASVVIFAGWMMRHLPATHQLGWACCPFLAIAVIVTLDVVTSDGSVAAQIFFFFPALYGASQLKARGAAAVTASAVVGEVVVMAATLPNRTGVVDIVYVGAALVTTAALLIGSARRQDALVAQLQRQAAIDSLTGLATRRVLDRAAQSALSGAASGDGIGLVLLDVDEFKSVNDRHGHPGGDQVLVQLAQLLVGNCRQDDVVSRLGGDEIALLLPGCSQSSLLRRADQILWDIRAHSFGVGDEQQIAISISAGLAHAPTHAKDLRTLYAAADAALYEAKRSGGNRVGGPPRITEARTGVDDSIRDQEDILFT